jgi:hypothetical protein
MEIKSLAGLTKPLRMLLKINIAVTAIAIPAGIYELYSYANLKPDVDPNETFLPADAVTIIIGLTQMYLFMILGITFLLWIYRVNKNLRALSGEEMRFSPGWSVGWYFIPFANIVMPYKVMKEIWQVSHRNRAATSPILPIWWILWLLSCYVGNAASRYAFKVDETVEHAASALSFIVSDGIDVALNIVALILVTRIGVAYSENYTEQEKRSVE